MATKKSASSGGASAPAALIAAVEQHLARVKNKYCYGLPHYAKTAKLKVVPVRIGSRALFDENDVDEEASEGWLPFAALADEAQFLAIRTEAPFAVAMWEHETGEFMPLAPSVEAFAASLLPNKKSKTPYEVLEEALDAVSAQVDADRHAEALVAIERLAASVPTIETDVEDEALGRINNLWGLALNGVGRHADAIAAFERARRAKDHNARLNILDTLLEHTREPARALAMVIAAKDEGYLGAYEAFWLAMYHAIAALDLGDPQTAEAQLRAIVEKHRISDPAKVNEARERIESYARDGRPGAENAQQFASWIVPKSYAVTAEQAAENRAFWRSLPAAVRNAVCDELSTKERAVSGDDASDEDIARSFDVTRLELDDESPINDPAIFTRFTELTRLEFYGDPDSLEPLRALTKLARLKVNGRHVQRFAWPSRAQRALWVAAQRGDREAIARALAEGADMHARSSDHGRGAIHYATDGHRADLVCWLIERGADPWSGSHLERGSGVLQYFGDSDTKKILAAAEKAGVRPIESEPFRSFSYQRVVRGASFESPRLSLSAAIDDGKPLLHEWPSDVVLTMSKPKSDNKLADVMGIGYSDLVVSERVAELLRGDGHIELLPVTLARHDGSKVDGTYYIPNPPSRDCLVVDRCYPSWNIIDDESIDEIAAWVIDVDKTEGASMFRPARLNSAPILVTRALAEKLAGFDAAQIETLSR